MGVKSYDPAEVSLTVGAVQIGGYIQGTGIEFDFAEDRWKKSVGITGEVVRSKSNDKTGTVTIHLMQTSSSNDVLNGFLLADDAGNAGVVPFALVDINSGTTIAAGESWVKKPPKVDFGAEASERMWVLDTGQALGFFSGQDS